MVKLSVCVEMLFHEQPFLDRIRSVADLNLPGFEFWGIANKDLDAIVKLRDELGLTLVGMVGTSQPLTDPEKREAAVRELKKNIQLAKDIQCRSLIVTSGPEQANLTPEEQLGNITAVLKEVASTAEEAGVLIVLEPLNTVVNHPGIFLNSSYTGYEILRNVGSPNVKLLFDIYHQQITERNIIANIREHMEYIGHFHLADVPGRQEPGTGELNYANIFKAIANSNYDGFVGCEFRPSTNSKQALEYVKTLL